MMNKILHRITKVTDMICYIVSFFSIAVLVVLVVMVGSDIVIGNILKKPVSGLYEICQVLLTTFIFSTWAYTQTVHGHIHVTLFISKFPPKIRFLSFAFTSFLSVVVTAIASYGLVGQIQLLMRTRECTGTLQIPYWPFYVFELAAFVLLTIVLFFDALKAVNAMWDKDMAREIESTW